MKLPNILLITIFFAATTSCMAQKKTSIQTFAIDSKVLEQNKKKISSGDGNAGAAYKKLLKEADKALAFGPVSVMEKNVVPPSGDKHDYMSLAPYHWPDPSKKDGLPYLRRDGETNPEVKEYKDKEYMPALCDKVYKLSLAYYFSGDNRYASHAAKLVKTWFLDDATRMNPNMNFAQAIKGVNSGRGAGLIDARHFVKLIDGIGLIQSSKYWTANDQQKMQAWFTDFLNWMQASKNGMDEMKAKNNHGAWYDALRLSIALYTNDTEHAKNIVRNAQQRLHEQMDADGMFPLEMERTTSLHYTVFVMDAFFNIAQMAEHTGIDFWKYTSTSGNSLKKAFDTMLPYLTNKKEWIGPQIKTFDFKEVYQVLSMGAANYDCKKCKQYLIELAGNEAGGLLTNLLYL